MAQKKSIIIELDGSWVLNHREDEVLPIAALAAYVKMAGNFEVKESSLTTITLIYDENNARFDGVKNYVNQFFASLYPNDKIEKVLTFHSGEDVEEDTDKKQDKEDEEVKDEDKTEKESKDSSSADDPISKLERRRKELIDRLEKLAAMDDEEDEEEDEEENKENNEDSDDGVKVIDKINELVGAVEFKALAQELVAISDEVKRTDTYEVFNSQCYLFSIGDGYGLTTYLELLADLVKETGLCKDSVVREEKLGAYRESMEPFESVLHAFNGSFSRKNTVLCVDISAWMDKTDNGYFKQFLRTVEKHTDDYIVVFRVPFVDKDVLARIQFSLADLLSVKALSFPPFSQEEIKVCAERELKRFNFSIVKPAWKYFFDRISEEKSDGKFYGVNTVKKVVRELVYQKHVSNSQKQNKSSQITVSDAKALCFNVDDTNLTGEEQLNKLVGIETIKKRIDEIIAQIELAMKEGGTQRPCIHMRFVGNPGTGKTTAARIIGKILKERGVLRVGAFFEYAGRDFCGRYIGETAPKTAGICRDAYGSVLFIDEAYSLYRGDSDTKDFGREAIDTLIAEMENHRNDFVVIMAGYHDDMDKLMKGNLGLASRMPYTIEFPNFTREQLNEIFVSMVKSKFKYDNQLLEVAREFFLSLPDGIINAKEFANARFVRNLFERTWAKAAMRCQLSGKKDVVLIGEDFEHASADKEFGSNVLKKTKIGF